MRWSRAYEDCDDVPSKPRDGLVWWSPPVESCCEATVEEPHWTQRLFTGPRSGMPYVLQLVRRTGLGCHSILSQPPGNLGPGCPAHSRGAPQQPLDRPQWRGRSCCAFVQWLDAPLSERAEGSCGGCAHLTGGEASPPYHYGVLLARAFAEPLAVPELRVRQSAAAAAGCDRSQGQCVDQSICELVCCGRLDVGA
eukprot:scaffold60895_cov63-Phaeocystis_antarctica.AAC.2